MITLKGLTYGLVILFLGFFLGIGTAANYRQDICKTTINRTN